MTPARPLRAAAIVATIALASTAEPARAQGFAVFARSQDGHVQRATSPNDWQRLDAQAVGSPDAAGRGVSVRGSDDALWWLPFDGAPERVESVVRSGPGAATNAAGNVAAAVVGTDGAAWLVVRAANGWGAWESLGGRFPEGSAPDVAWSSPDTIEVVARGLDGAAWRGARRSGAWSGWSSTGVAVSGGPALALDGAAAVLVHVGSDSQAHFGSTTLGGAFTPGDGIDACADGAGTVAVVARGRDGAAWVNRRSAGAWSGWSSWGGSVEGDPTCTFEAPAGSGGSKVPESSKGPWNDPAAMEAALRRWAQPLGSEAVAALGEIRKATRGIEIDSDAVAKHVVRPKDAGREIFETVEPLRAPLEAVRDAKLVPFDLDAYRQGATAALSGAAGYYLELRRGGEPILTLQQGVARRSLGPSGGLDWSGTRRIHVASVSKAITAMAMTRLMEQRGVSVDDRIAAYLPASWTLGPGVDRITFRDLLTHRSGLMTPAPFSGGDSSYPAMRAAIAVGSAGTGTPQYQNVNFGLCRILMPILAGSFPRERAFGTLTLPPWLSDGIWDAIAVQAYQQQVQSLVFDPAGVRGPTISVVTDDAIAETLPPTGGGWDSDFPTGLEYMTATVGWHVSAQEMLAVLRTFRSAGTIVSPQSAERMLAAGIGMDAVTRTRAGLVATKSGYWEVPGQGCEQAIASVLPNDMELVVLVNSRMAPAGGSLMGTMDALFASCLR